MSLPLTQAQAELLAFIQRYTEENNGVAPSFEEMKQAIGLASKSGVHRLVQSLEERGRITRLRDRARCITVVPDNPLTDFPTTALIAELARRGERARTERCLEPA